MNKLNIYRKWGLWVFSQMALWYIIINPDRIGTWMGVLMYNFKIAFER